MEIFNEQLTKKLLTAVTTAIIEEISPHSNNSYYGRDQRTKKNCHLTLQPFRNEDKRTTKDEPSFQGQQFMCASTFFSS